MVQRWKVETFSACTVNNCRQYRPIDGWVAAQRPGKTEIVLVSAKLQIDTHSLGISQPLLPYIE